MLLIDDLDRCPEGHVVEVLETVQKLLRDQSANSTSVGRKPPPGVEPIGEGWPGRACIGAGPPTLVTDCVIVIAFLN